MKKIINSKQRRGSSKKTTPKALLKGVTIDASTSRDLDDAIWIQKNQKGNYVVDIMIAHVVDSVPIGGRIYNHAYSQVNTIYLPNGNVPMIYRYLSEKECSLLPKSIKKVFHFRIMIDHKTLEKKLVAVKEAQMKSIAKLSYERVESMIRNESLQAPTSKDVEITEMIQIGDELAMRLLKERRMKGALAIYDINKGIYTDEEGNVKLIHENDAHRAHILVQECMILTNMLVAEYLHNNNIQCIMRNHTAKVISFSWDGILSQYDVTLQGAKGTYSAVEDLQKLCNTYMNKATYGIEVLGHVGLNVAYYAHFTSPIRRLSDLMNQYILVSFLRKKTLPFTNDELQHIVYHINKTQDSRRTKKLEHYRKTATKLLEKKKQSNESFESMTRKDVSKIIKTASTNQDTMAQYAESIMMYIKQKLLQPIDMMHILLNPPVCEEHETLQREIILYLSQNIYLAKSIAEIATTFEYLQSQVSTSQQSINPAIFHTKVEYSLFAPQDKKRVLQNGIEEIVSPTKKTGEHMVYCKVFAKLIGIDLADTVFVQKKTIQSLPLQASKESQGFEDIVEAHENDPIGMLQRIADRAKLTPPSYVFSERPEIGWFDVQVSFSFEEKEYMCKTFAFTKRAAKRAVAEKLVNQIRLLLIKK